ncbi:hypothetical protein [Anaeromicrobium sediminis]|uniref:Uncharacterized protein n=1 Tax=Anaeromicrobium sediminis TaxID=1478221 RepID=A0A267MAQ6_9FIRM|nr:hypothetical protein [Anaeromicrobium sediminis]PAB55998.1 hypothetical protein CCE28_21355 [Anaeromicrobium sediminis]
MKKIVFIVLIALLCIGCTDHRIIDHRSYVNQEDVDKINEYEVVASVINSLRAQDYNTLSEIFVANADNLKNYRSDENMKVVFEATNYRLESFEESGTEIKAVLNINMPFTRELSNVATQITWNKTTKSDGTPDFSIEPETTRKIWNEAFIKQIKSEKGARIVYDYELEFVKVNDKWLIKNDPNEFLKIFFGDYVKNYSDYWYEENSDYYDIWID